MGMAGMPYPPNLCISVQSVGEYLAPENSVGSVNSVGRLSPIVCSVGIVGAAGTAAPPGWQMQKKH